MSTAQNILDSIAASKAAADANAAAVLAEIARVEAVIAALGAPQLTQAQIDQAVLDLQGVVTELGATTAAASAERP